MVQSNARFRPAGPTIVRCRSTNVAAAVFEPTNREGWDHVNTQCWTSARGWSEYIGDYWNICWNLLGHNGGTSNVSKHNWKNVHRCHEHTTGPLIWLTIPFGHHLNTSRSNSYVLRSSPVITSLIMSRKKRQTRYLQRLFQNICYMFEMLHIRP